MYCSQGRLAQLCQNVNYQTEPPNVLWKLGSVDDLREGNPLLPSAEVISKSENIPGPAFDLKTHRTSLTLLWKSYGKLDETFSQIPAGIRTWAVRNGRV